MHVQSPLLASEGNTLFARTCEPKFAVAQIGAIRGEPVSSWVDWR